MSDKIYNAIFTPVAYVVGVVALVLVATFIVVNVVDLFNGSEAQEPSGCNCGFGCDTEIRTIDGIDYCDCANCEGFER